MGVGAGADWFIRCTGTRARSGANNQGTAPPHTCHHPKQPTTRTLRAAKHTPPPPLHTSAVRIDVASIAGEVASVGPTGKAKVNDGDAIDGERVQGVVKLGRVLQDTHLKHLSAAPVCRGGHTHPHICTNTKAQGGGGGGRLGVVRAGGSGSGRGEAAGTATNIGGAGDAAMGKSG